MLKIFINKIIKEGFLSFFNYNTGGNMRVSELFKSFDYEIISGSDDVDINKITDNTNDILDGDLFLYKRI